MGDSRASSSARRDGLKSVLKELGRAAASNEKLRVREQQARKALHAAQERARGNDQKPLVKVVSKARERAGALSKLRREAAAKLREARKLVREQEQLALEAERKERARQRALAEFLKLWEREYDRKMSMKKKNIRLRKQEIRRT